MGIGGNWDERNVFYVLSEFAMMVLKIMEITIVSLDVIYKLPGPERTMLYGYKNQV